MKTKNVPVENCSCCGKSFDQCGRRKNYLGVVLCEIREEHKKTKEDFAKILNITVEEVTALESPGLKKATVEQLILIGKALKINPLEITDRAISKSPLIIRGEKIMKNKKRSKK